MIAGNIRRWRFWQVEERIYWLYKPIGDKLIGKELRSCDAKLTSIWRGVPEDGRKNPHPAPFPIWLPARIIISILETGTPGVVLDPYIGSGTTAVAAKLLGHKYIVIDRSDAYLEMAIEGWIMLQGKCLKYERNKDYTMCKGRLRTVRQKASMLANIVTQMTKRILYNPLYLNDSYCMLGEMEEGYHLICARNSP